jgi:hypothetical protein
MEQALRQGNMDAIDDTLNDAGLDIRHELAHNANLYAPAPETYAKAPSDVKVVPIVMYDPSTGQNTTSVTGRGKNQINQLMSHAANLELQRTRTSDGNTNLQKQSSHRANAKHKYGW